MIPSDAAGRRWAWLTGWLAHPRLAALRRDAGLASEASSAEADRMIEAVGRGHGRDPDVCGPPD